MGGGVKKIPALLHMNCSEVVKSRSGRGFELTCIHRKCRHSCPGTPRLGAGPLFLSLKRKIKRGDMSDLHMKCGR